MKHAIQHIHFVGIGGVGMSGIAEVLFNLGYSISGSDQSDSATSRRLASLGIAVKIGHDAAHIEGRSIVAADRNGAGCRQAADGVAGDVADVDEAAADADAHERARCAGAAHDAAQADGSDGVALYARSRGRAMRREIDGNEFRAT